MRSNTRLKSTYMAASLVVATGLAIGACSDDDPSTSATGCPTGLAECGAACVDTDYDPANCGSCGNACPAGELCSMGQCGVECLGGTTECAGVCVDPDYDPAHCGGCDNACQAGEVCSMGQCGGDCLGGTSLCGDACVDTDVDPAHCGGCDNDCQPGEVCSAGSCALECGGGTTLCDGLCVDTLVDPGNCGGCADDPNQGDNICALDEICAAGTCELSCPAPTEDCSGVCVNTMYDPNHCGGCGDPCGADEACVDGDCTPVQVCTWTPALLPVQVHASNYCGDIAFDRNCDLIVGGCLTGEVYGVSRLTGAVSTLVTMPQASRAVTYRPSDATIYIADSDELYSFDGNLTNLINIGSSISSIAVAPAGWGTYGDQIIATKHTGEVYAINPSGPSATLIGTTTGNLANQAFAADGTLYVANYNNNKVQTMTPAGVFADFVTGINGPDGIDVDDDNARLFVSSDADDEVYSVTIPGGVATSIGAAVFDNGWAPSGLLWDGDGTLLMKAQCAGGGACIDAMQP